MNYQSKSVVLGTAFGATVLAALGARPAAALLVAPKVRLSKAPGFAPAPGSAIVDFSVNEADFVGYTAGGYAPTFSAPLNISTTALGILANVLPTCSGAGAPSPNNVYGWWMDDGANVVMAERFANGLFFSFVNPMDFLDLQVVVPFDLYQLVQA